MELENETHVLRQQLASTSQQASSQSIRQLNVPAVSSQPAIYSPGFEGDLALDKAPAIRDRTYPVTAAESASEFDFVGESGTVNLSIYPENELGSNVHIPPSPKSLDGIELGPKVIEEIFSM